MNADARETALNAIGRAYIEMRHNRAVGFMVVIEGEGSKAMLVSYNMDPDAVISTMLNFAEDLNNELGEREE